jgi:hypothetical protein
VVSPQTTWNGVVTIDPNTTRSDVAWDHSLAGTNDKRWYHTIGMTNAVMMPRSWMMNRRSVGRHTDGYQKPQRKNETHRNCSIDKTTPRSLHGRMAGDRASSNRLGRRRRILDRLHHMRSGKHRPKV